MASVASDRIFNAKWIKLHRVLAESSNATILIAGDSLIVYLSRYFNVWEKYFVPFNKLNFGIGVDLIENVFWLSNDLLPLSSVKHVILSVTDNLHKDSPYEIVDGLIATAYVLEKNMQ